MPPDLDAGQLDLRSGLCLGVEVGEHDDRVALLDHLVGVTWNFSTRSPIAPERLQDGLLALMHARHRDIRAVRPLPARVVGEASLTVSASPQSKASYPRFSASEFSGHGVPRAGGGSA
jgi:hypothetical protein